MKHVKQNHQRGLTFNLYPKTEWKIKRIIYKLPTRVKCESKTSWHFSDYNAPCDSLPYVENGLISFYELMTQRNLLIMRILAG